MKIDDLRKSSNIEDRRGQSSSNSSFSSGSSGGNVLLGLIFSRLGWKGKLLVLVLLVAFGGMSNLGGLLSPSTGTNPYQSSQVTTTGTDVSDADAEFMSKVLGSTEDFWVQEFKANGLTYNAPTMVFYTNQTQTGCGVGSAKPVHSIALLTARFILILLSIKNYLASIRLLVTLPWPMSSLMKLVTMFRMN